MAWKYQFIKGFSSHFGGLTQVYKKLWPLAALAIAVGSSGASAVDLEWAGRYRLEGSYIKNYTLDRNAAVEDYYFAHHLILEPKIVAFDGMLIKTRFDMANNSLNTYNQAGAVYGSYTGSPTPAAYFHSGADYDIRIGALYMNWINEFGSLIAGRTPYQFGLGMTFNAGAGAFDHWLTLKDMVGYKVALGNITLMPAAAKTHSSIFTTQTDINELMFVAEYANPESDLSMGIIYNTHSAAPDLNNSIGFFGANAQGQAAYNTYNMNLYVKKKTENFNVGVELGFLNGDPGVRDITNSNHFDFSGFGLATEFGYRLGDITLNLKAGLASGDDTSTSRFEGFYFNPNYEVGMLMFSQPLGQYDIMSTRFNGSRVSAVSPSLPTGNQITGLDSESISNAIYFAPQFKYAAGERHDLTVTFVYGTLMKPYVAAGFPGQSMGFETDLGYSYHPTEKLTWTTGVGFLFPGSAWAGVNNQFATDVAYGLTTKAAVSF